MPRALLTLFAALIALSPTAHARAGAPLSPRPAVVESIELWARYPLDLGKYCDGKHTTLEAVLASLMVRDSFTLDELRAGIAQAFGPEKASQFVEEIKRQDFAKLRRNAPRVVQDCSKMFSWSQDRQARRDAWLRAFSGAEQKMREGVEKEKKAEADYEAELARRKALSDRTVVPACTITTENKLSWLEEACRDENDGFRGTLRQLAALVRPIRIDSLQLKAPVTDITQALEIIGSTEKGREVLKKFLPKWQRGEIRIVDNDDSGFSKRCAEDHCLGVFNLETSTIHIRSDMKKELGVYVTTLFHEMIHSIDSEDRRAQYELKAEADALEAREKNSGQLEQQPWIDLGLRRERASFRAERLAFDSTYAFKQQLKALYPCYDGFLRAESQKVDDNGLHREDYDNISDADLAYTYRIDPALLKR